MAVLADVAPSAVDEARQMQEDAASSVDKACRQAAAREDLRCFVTLLGLEDEEAVLGLGVYAHARTVRQRRWGQPPDLDLVFDYVDVEAFNEGVRRAAPQAGERLPVLVSSARGRFNGWLPLYIHAQHWASARRFAVSAFSALANRRPGGTFKPKDALDICCSLLTCAVAGFTKSQTECASPRTASRGKASERAVQMYADVHRLLLQMAREYPEVHLEALQRVRRFIEDPVGRTRRGTPNLGNLVHCLLVVEEVTWEDLAPSLVPEALRRHVMRQECNCLTFRSNRCGRSAEQLVAAWDSFAPDVGKVVCFSVMFYQRVGRPSGWSLADVEAAYDRRWGRLREEVMAGVMGACAHLCQQHSVMDFLLPIIPGGACSVDHIAELILWAERHGTTESLGKPSWRAERRGRGAASAAAPPEAEWPAPRGPCPLLQEWLSRSLRRRRPRQPQQRWRPNAKQDAAEKRGQDPPQELQSTSAGESAAIVSDSLQGSLFVPQQNWQEARQLEHGQWLWLQPPSYWLLVPFVPQSPQLAAQPRSQDMQQQWEWLQWLQHLRHTRAR
uniref:Uncharacterized protein n=1 Tax=Pyrodinium bahamense TaxID=73915 RepID=A0A7S0AA38_9DINO|mmetsp:Transcript_29176/g.80079  ORF Transcript_29176/g.80079 Transcript_29176/m.80079 type:complete len:558 (+) Transcript_29176:58-1731(+)